MNYLDFDRLEALSPTEYQTTKPYPHANPEGILTPEGFEALRTNLPDVSILDPIFAKSRRAGQYPHDRYALEYEEGVEIPKPWEEFIAELRGDRYRSVLSRLLGVRTLEFRMHWHYTPRGCSVSPHCDAKRKLGSHIFYFNTAGDWDPSWGGETLVLDDAGRFKRASAPAFEDFDSATPAESIGNRSFIFSRCGNSWHGVRPLNCPEDRMRKVFIVVLNQCTPLYRLRDAVTRKQITRL